MLQQPGALAYDRDGQLLTVLSLGVAGGRVQAIRSVVNPDKPRHLGPIPPFGRPDPASVS
jgi:RNA polymerase sigma-70 factor, ECF subfamily